MTKKQIEAAIKPEFITRLKQLRIKTKFINNVLDPKWAYGVNVKEALRICTTTDNWYTFFNHGFSFKNSTEGFEFWIKMKYKFE